MQWHLLNQLSVNSDYRRCVISVLEEVVSSEEQLVLLLVSGMVSHRTMSLDGQVEDVFNQTELTEEFRL